MAVITINGEDELRARAGSELGVSGWHQIDQDQVDRFADLTGDHQWIHVDRERAKGSPFGSTIVHGYFTLALVPKVNDEVFALEGFDFGLNYGLDKVRFPAPLPTGSRVRASIAIDTVDDVAGGVQAKFVTTFEVEGSGKPVCVAESLVRLYSGATS